MVNKLNNFTKSGLVLMLVGILFLIIALNTPFTDFGGTIFVYILAGVSLLIGCILSFVGGVKEHRS